MAPTSLATVGRLILGIVEPSGARHDVLTLAPLAVAPGYERRGIGSALVRAGLTAADETGAGLVTLEGSPAYYGRLGFRFAPAFGIAIDMPEWAPPQAAQMYVLTAYDSTVRGKLEYLRRSQPSPKPHLGQWCVVRRAPAQRQDHRRGRLVSLRSAAEAGVPVRREAARPDRRASVHPDRCVDSFPAVARPWDQSTSGPRGLASPGRPRRSP